MCILFSMSQLLRYAIWLFILSFSEAQLLAVETSRVLSFFFLFPVPKGAITTFEETETRRFSGNYLSERQMLGVKFVVPLGICVWKFSGVVVIMSSLHLPMKLCGRLF